MKRESTEEKKIPKKYWDALSMEDRLEYMKLHQEFAKEQTLTVKDKRVVTFTRELQRLWAFITRTDSNIEERSIVVGISFAREYVCVNNRQLKWFLGRCKSSINNSFQQIGYLTVRSKITARECVMSALPILKEEKILLRQWTVRSVTENAIICMRPTTADGMGMDLASIYTANEEFEDNLLPTYDEWNDAHMEFDQHVMIDSFMADRSNSPFSQASFDFIEFNV